MISLRPLYTFFYSFKKKAFDCAHNLSFLCFIKKQIQVQSGAFYQSRLVTRKCKWINEDKLIKSEKGVHENKIILLII